jgi:ubiquinol-cytochrome c reductase iron-sulfur subunit
MGCSSCYLLSNDRRASLPNRAHSDKPQTRRSFLAAATAGAMLVGIGAGTVGLLGSLSPAADVVAANKPIEVDISGIAEGTELRIQINRLPVIIRHRRLDEIAAAEGADPSGMIDPFSRDMFGRKPGSADDRLRRSSRDGRFIVLLAQCTRLQCIVQSGAGDFASWFCPCCSTHYDSSGRVRKGAAPWNLLLAVTTQMADGKLLIAPTLLSAQGRQFSKS